MFTRNVRLALFALVLTPVLQWILDKDMVYIYCAIGLLLFIGIRTLIDLRVEIAKAGKKNLFIDRDYTRWQTKKTE